MEIRQINIANNLTFGVLASTAHLLEITTLKIFEPDGFLGMTNTLKKIYPLPQSTGERGYRYYAELAGKEIMQKYTKINDATIALNKFFRQNPKATASEVHYMASSYVAKIGEYIDINL